MDRRNLTFLTAGLLLPAILLNSYFGGSRLRNKRKKSVTSPTTLWDPSKKSYDISVTTPTTAWDPSGKTSKKSVTTPKTSREPFNETNPHKTSWCPNATCHNSPICAPCNRRYLFILATPRSGSTTILTTLNALPGVRLSGENPGVFVDFWKLIGGKETGDFRQMTNLLTINRDQPNGAHMHNAIPKQAMACTAQQFMNTLNPPPLSVQNNANVLPLSQYDSSTIMGSKMIRVQRGDWTKIEGGKADPKLAAEFIKTHFPCSRVVVNVRSNLKKQISSINTTFVARHHVTDELGLFKERKFLLSLADELGEDQAYVIKLERWSKDTSVLNKLIKWIGFKGCGLDHILHNNQGSNGYEQDNRTDTLLEASCRYPHS